MPPDPKYNECEKRWYKWSSGEGILPLAALLSCCGLCTAPVECCLVDRLPFFIGDTYALVVCFTKLPFEKFDSPTTPLVGPHATSRRHGHVVRVSRTTIMDDSQCSRYGASRWEQEGVVWSLHCSILWETLECERT